MQEPSSMRDQNRELLSQVFPIGVVIKQEEEAPRRVQVRIPVLHTDIEDEDLPFFRVMLPLTATGQDGRSGSYVTIAQGTEVQCILYDPRGYSGAIFGMFANTKTDIAKADDVHGWRDDAGNSFNVDKEGDMTLTGAGGSSVVMTKDNAITVTCQELTLNIGNISITAEELTELITNISSTSQSWEISSAAPNIKDGAGGGGGSGTAPDITAPELPDRLDVSNKKDM